MSTEHDPDNDSQGRAAAKPAAAEPTESAELEETDESAESGKSVDRESHTVYSCGTK